MRNKIMKLLETAGLNIHIAKQVADSIIMECSVNCPAQQKQPDSTMLYQIRDMIRHDKGNLCISQQIGCSENLVMLVRDSLIIEAMEPSKL